MTEEKKQSVEKLKLEFDRTVAKEIRRLQLGVQQCYEDMCRIRDSKVFPIKSNEHVSNAASVFQEKLAENLRKFVTPERREKQEQIPVAAKPGEEKEKISEKNDLLKELLEKFPGNTLHPDIHAFLMGDELTMPEKQFLLDFLPPLNDELQSLKEQDKFLKDLQEKMEKEKLVCVSIVDIVAECYKVLLKQREEIDDYLEFPKEETELDRQKVRVDDFIKRKVVEAMRIHFVTNLQNSAEKFAKNLFADSKENPEAKNYFPVPKDLQKKFDDVLSRLSAAKNEKQIETDELDKMTSKAFDHIAKLPAEKEQGMLYDFQTEAMFRHQELNLLKKKLENAQNELQQIKISLAAGQKPRQSEMLFFPFADDFEKLCVLRQKYFYLMEFASRQKSEITLDEALKFYANNRSELIKYHENSEVGSYEASMLQDLVKMAPWLREQVHLKKGFIWIAPSELGKKNLPSVLGGPVNFHKPPSSSHSPASVADTLSFPSKSVLQASGYNPYRK